MRQTRAPSGTRRDTGPEAYLPSGHGQATKKRTRPSLFLTPSLRIRPWHLPGTTLHPSTSSAVWVLRSSTDPHHESTHRGTALNSRAMLQRTRMYIMCLQNDIDD